MSWGYCQADIMGLTRFDGQGLGPMTAEAKGTFGDLIPTVGHGASCVRANKFAELQVAGLSSLQGVPVKVKYRKEPGIQVMEFQVQSLVSLASPSYPAGRQPCEICGRSTLRELKDDQVTIKRSSIPTEADLFGLREWDKGPIVTERFKRIGEGILSNAEFVEIPIVDE